MRALAAPALAALIAACPCCKHGAARHDGAPRGIEVGRIAVTWVDAIDEITVARDEVKEKKLAKALAERISRRKDVTAGVAGRDPLELSVVSSARTDADGGAAGEGNVLAFNLGTTWGDGWKISSSILTELPSGSVEEAGPVLDDLLDDLVAQLDLFDMDSAGLIRAVEKRDCAGDGVCATAIRLLGERHEAEAVGVLVGKLGDADPSDPVMDDIVGALGRIGDERATPALVETFNRVHPVQQVAILDAIASCGGEDARLFLEVVASGHESPVMREQARRHLDSMDNGGP
jgi:hypothetical protein